MTIPRVAGLVIEAAFLADGLSTFVLEMGQPRVIADLVNRYAAGCGYPVPAIRFTGRRAGEKLGEELVADGETPRPTLHPAITAVDAVTVPPDGIVRWYAPDESVSERKTAGSRPGVPVAEAVEWFRSQPAAACPPRPQRPWRPKTHT